MSWQNLAQELAEEFDQHYEERAEFALFNKDQARRDAWREYWEWFRKTAAGRASERATNERQRAKRRQTIVGRATCPCGREFQLSAEQAYRRVVYCKPGCPAMHPKKARLWNGRTLAQWSQLSGVRPYTLRQRLLRGWPIEWALTAPPGATKNGTEHRCSLARSVAKPGDTPPRGVSSKAAEEESIGQKF